MSASRRVLISGCLLAALTAQHILAENTRPAIARLSIDGRIYDRYFRIREYDDGYEVSCSDLTTIINTTEFLACEWVDLSVLGELHELSHDAVGNPLLAITPRAAVPAHVSVNAVNARPQPDDNFGAYLNYEISASSFQNKVWAGSLKPVIFNGPFSATALLYYVDGNQYIDNRDISYDFLNLGTRLTVGDVRWGGAAMGPYISFDGVRYGTERSLRPRDSWFNRPYHYTVVNDNEHYFVDQRTSATLADPGLYRLNDVAYQYGYGEITGTYESPSLGTTTISTPYYFSAEMLPEGVKEWSVNAGETDRESMFADEYFVAADIGYGINANNTAIASVFSSSDYQSLDIEWIATPFSSWLVSIGSNSLFEQDQFSQGYSAKVERTSNEYQAIFFTQRTPNLPNFGRSERHLARYRLYRDNQSYGVFYEHFNYKYGTTKRAGFELYTNDELGSFNIQSGYTEDEFNQGFFVSLGFEIRFNRNSRLRGFGNYSPQRNQQRLEYASSGVDRYSPNYRVGVTRDESATVNYTDIDYQADFADFYMYAQENDGDADGRAAMRGAIGFIEQYRFAAPTVVDGFAYVDNPEAISLTSGAITSHSTSTVFTNVASYESVKIKPRYKSMDPFLTLQSSASRERAAYYRSGVVIDFSLREVAILNTRLTLENGDYLPLATEFKVNEKLFNVGSNGNFYAEVVVKEANSQIDLLNQQYRCALITGDIINHQITVISVSCHKLQRE